MKSRRVLWSRDALDELEESIGYIAQDNPTAARRVARAIRECGGKLGQTATGRIGRVAGTYEKVVPHLPYLIAYALDTTPDGREAVVILRIIHAARDWPDEDWPEPA